MPNKGWEHLGDGVYAKYDGFGMLLHANSHIDPTDRIYLEHSVFKSLVEFREREREKMKRHQGMKEKHTENYGGD